MARDGVEWGVKNRIRATAPPLTRVSTSRPFRDEPFIKQFCRIQPKTRMVSTRKNMIEALHSAAASRINSGKMIFVNPLPLQDARR